ncbi:MAG: ABC transporter permease [Polyangiaceae bacterium]|nr:ABC transporter permease [Polyangiaceae bacterium]
MTRLWARRLRRIVLPAALLAVWVVLSRSRTYSYAFVPLGELARGARELVMNGELPRGLVASLCKAFAGLLLGIPAGVLVGGAMGVSRTVDRAIGPVLHAIRQVPYLGLAPLMGLWFGGGDVAKIILVFMAVFYPVVLSTYEGVHDVEPKLVDVARVLRLTRRQVATKLVLPSVLPHLYTGISQAIAFAWIATVGSEMLLHAGIGIGTMLQAAEAGGRTDLVFVCVFSVALASLAIDSLVGTARRRMLRWRDDAWNAR